MNLVPFILSLSSRVTQTINKEIESIADVDDIVVDYDTAFNDIGLPSSLIVVFEADNGTQALAIDWQGSYDEETAGTYALVGVPILPSGVYNTAGITASVNVVVNYPEFVVSEDYVEFTGAQLISGESTSFQYSSHFYRERLKYHLGKTYFTYGTPYENKPYSQAKLLVYDKDRGFDRPFNVGDILTLSDSHTVPALQIANSKVHVIQEHVHDTALRQYSSWTTADYNYSHMVPQSNIGTSLSYVHLIEKADGNFAIWSRGIAAPTANYYSIHVTEASDGMQTWGAQRQITSRPTGNDPLLRHYPFLPFGRYKAAGKIFVGWTARHDTGSAFYRHHIATTPDSGADCLRVFTNIEGTYTHDVDVDGILTDAISSANFAFLTMNTATTQGGAAMTSISPEGKFYAIIPDTDGSNDLFLKYYEDGGWVTKPLTIVGAAEFVGTYLTANYLSVLSDYDIRYIDQFTHGSFTKPHWVRTTDQGDTWEDLGDMNPDVTAYTLKALVVNNYLDIPPNTNFPIYFAALDGVTTNTARLFCREAAWGAIQAVPGVTVTPASTMNYNSTGLFHYICQDAYMTRTGTAINTLVDQFGLRNAATGTNKPVWNNVDTATLTAANNERFIPGTPATLCNKDAFTFICVAKSSGTQFIMLCFSLTSATNKYFEFTLETNLLSLRMTNTFTHFVNTQDTINDGNFHVFAITTNGRNTTNMYVDGKLQYFQTNLTDASGDTLWDDIGQGAATVGANIVHIGFRDLSSGDLYSTGAFKEMALFSSVIPQTELQARILKLCNDYSITYQGYNQFQTT